MKYTLTRRSSGDRVEQIAVVADTWTYSHRGDLMFVKNGLTVLMVNSRYWISLSEQPAPQDAPPQDSPPKSKPKMTAEPYPTAQGYPTHWGYPQPRDDQWL